MQGMQEDQYNVNQVYKNKYAKRRFGYLRSFYNSFSADVRDINAKRFGIKQLE